MIRFVVFDLGKVLSSPPDIYRAPAELLGVDPEAYRSLYWTYRPLYDAGGSRVEYWQPILEGLDVQPTGELISTLAQLDSDLWLQLRPSALDVVNEVYAWGLRTALLSNAPLVMGRAIRQAEWAPLFDHIFISAELGITKPDPEIFRLVNAQLEVAPDEVAFIDDREPNVTEAIRFGWHAHLWVDDADTRAWISEVCGREQPEAVG